MSSYGSRKRISIDLLANVRTSGPAGAILALLLVAACASAGQSGKTPVPTSAASTMKPSTPSKVPDLPMRAQLPDEAREMLTERMLRHGEDMAGLTAAVLMLEYELTQILAIAIADEPKLGRPAPGETGTLNALLPKDFFVQQDALAVSAKALASAAAKRDDTQIAASFGEVTKACVGCHSAYLNAELDPPTYAREDRTLPCGPEQACGEE